MCSCISVYILCACMQKHRDQERASDALNSGHVGHVSPIVGAGNWTASALTCWAPPACSVHFYLMGFRILSATSYLTNESFRKWIRYTQMFTHRCCQFIRYYCYWITVWISKVCIVHSIWGFACLFLFFEAVSHHVALASLELPEICLPLSPAHWDMCDCECVLCVCVLILSTIKRQRWWDPALSATSTPVDKHLLCF